MPSTTGARDEGRPAQPAEGQTREALEGRPPRAERPTCVAHLPQHVGLQRLGDLARDGPEQPST